MGRLISVIIGLIGIAFLISYFQNKPKPQPQPKPKPQPKPLPKVVTENPDTQQVVVTQGNKVVAVATKDVNQAIDYLTANNLVKDNFNNVKQSIDSGIVPSQFLINWANGHDNGLPNFNYNGLNFDSITGNAISKLKEFI